MSTIKAAIKRLSNYPPDAPACMVLWLDDDVFSRANERKLTVSDELTAEILESLEHTHDANYGITWDHIDAALDANLDHEGLIKSTRSSS